MSIEFLRYPSYLFVVLLAATMVCLVVAFIMCFFVPKPMLKAYFREPYFSRGEIAIYSAFPFNYFRVFMFMRLAGWPNSGKKRGLTEAYKLAPLWFRRVSKILVSAFVLVSTPMFALGIFLYLSFCLLHGHC